MIDTRIGQRIRFARLEARMSQDALAAKLGLTFQQVQKYEKGASRLPVSRLLEIARVLGVSPDRLLQSDLPDAATGDGDAFTQDHDNVWRALETPGGISLLCAYAKIESPTLRRHVLAIVAALNGDEGRI